MPLRLWISVLEGCAHLQDILDWQPSYLSADMFWAIPATVDGVRTLIGKLGNLHECSAAPRAGTVKTGILLPASLYLAPESQPTCADGSVRAAENVMVARSSPSYGAGLVLQGILYQCEAVQSFNSIESRQHMCVSMHDVRCAAIEYACQSWFVVKWKSSAACLLLYGCCSTFAPFAACCYV